MYMPEETEKSKRINVRVPIELYSQVVQSYGITEAVILGLHKLLEKPEGTKHIARRKQNQWRPYDELDQSNRELGRATEGKRYTDRKVNRDSASSGCTSTDDDSTESN